MDARKWVKRGLSGALILVFTVAMTVGVIALSKDSNKKSGVLTLYVSTNIRGPGARTNSDHQVQLYGALGEYRTRKKYSSRSRSISIN